MYYFVYKYQTIKDNKIVYVGITTRSLSSRVYEHSREHSFQKLENYDIWYASLRSKADMVLMEKLLISKYRPILNTKDNNYVSFGVSFDEPYWKIYDENFDKVEAFIDIGKVNTDTKVMEDRFKQSHDDTEDAVNVKIAKELISMCHEYLWTLKSIKRGIKQRVFSDPESILKEDIQLDFPASYMMMANEILESSEMGKWFLVKKRTDNVDLVLEPSDKYIKASIKVRNANVSYAVVFKEYSCLEQEERALYDAIDFLATEIIETINKNWFSCLFEAIENAREVLNSIKFSQYIFGTGQPHSKNLS